MISAFQARVRRGFDSWRFVHGRGRRGFDKMRFVHGPWFRGFSNAVVVHVHGLRGIALDQTLPVVAQAYNDGIWG